MSKDRVVVIAMKSHKKKNDMTQNVAIIKGVRTEFIS